MIQQEAFEAFSSSTNGIAKLRQLILELAVRGLLVPQDPNDEPVSVLLEKITEERTRLIKEGKIKETKEDQKVNIAEMSFELPNGWEWSFIPQVVSNDKYSIKRGPFGSAIKKDFFVPSGYKVYEQQHAINNDFSLGKYYISEEKFNELKAFEIKPNDLIISCSGTVGKVAIAPSWMEPGIINQALLKLSLNEKALTNDYFKILFTAFYMKTETLSDLQGTAQKNMVSVEILKKEPFPLPPLAEQHRIVTKVDKLMALCDQLEQRQNHSNTVHQRLLQTLLESLTQAVDNEAFQKIWSQIAAHFDMLFTNEASIDQLKQVILQLAVMGKLVPQDPNDEPASVLLEKIAEEKARLVKEGKIKKQNPLPKINEEEKPFQLPIGWEWVRLGRALKKITDGTHHSPLNGEKGEYLYISAKNIKSEGIMLSNATYVTREVHDEIYSRCDPEYGDLLYIKDGATTGIVTINNLKEPFSMLSSVALLKVPKGILNSYLLLSLRSPYFYNEMRAGMTGVAITRVTLNKLDNAIISIPSLAEQHRIVAKVDELMAICDQLKSQISKSQQIQEHLATAIVKKAAA
jgi:type I restriction enzyme S subunit